jgi:hypothetical protein
MGPGDLVIAHREWVTWFDKGTPALVVDVISLGHGVTVCILVDGRLIWVNGEMLEVLNGSG